ncbi:hypothetical protein GCM10027048_38450 [Hymenobacter coalescens]
MHSSSPALRRSRFPLVFELLIWSLYVVIYKYGLFYLEQATSLHRVARTNFPYPQLILFTLAATLYIVPYYRWLLPTLVRKGWYALLAVSSVLYLWWGIKLGTFLAAAVFRLVAEPPVLLDFYESYYQPGLRHLLSAANPQLAVLATDVMAFSCVAFVRIAFDNEARRHQLEQDHLQLQMEQLKAQLQPHFLLNTLNSIYGLSLAGSPETPRFILLLSELMRYVLYDSGKAAVPLVEEVAFLENYFEMEQRKYPGARISLATLAGTDAPIQVPPLLLLPLVENSFKHGRHHLADQAAVEATLTTAPGQLCFTIENDMLPAPPPAPARRSGGIGLRNIRQRLNLYYPNAHELLITEQAGRYRAQLTLQLPQ